MALFSKKSAKNKALKRLRMLRSIHEQPTALRRGLGLKRRKMTRSQKFVRFLATR